MQLFKFKYYYKVDFPSTFFFSFSVVVYSTSVQIQKAVSAYGTSKQILPFGFAG